MWSLLTCRFAVPAAFFLMIWSNGALGLMAAEWQWTVEVAGDVSRETKALPRAFLWVPPRCERVRAVILAQHNMQEQPILEDAGFRETLSRLDVAAIWVTPSVDDGAHLSDGAGERLLAMLSAFANLSGYQELASAPVIPVGHSAQASFPWEFAAWNPARTLAVISLSGQWPYTPAVRASFPQVGL